MRIMKANIFRTPASGRNRLLPKSIVQFLDTILPQWLFLRRYHFDFDFDIPRANFWNGMCADLVTEYLGHSGLSSDLQPESLRLCPFSRHILMHLVPLKSVPDM